MPERKATEVSYFTIKPNRSVLADAAVRLGTRNPRGAEKAREQIHVGSLNSGCFKPAHRDGGLPSSRFRSPMGISRMPGGRGVVVADTGNNAIREISLSGEGTVRTLEGGRWLRPTDVCTSPDGYAVCDSGHHRVSLLSFAGKLVTPLAGCGKMGFLDVSLNSETLSVNTRRHLYISCY
jgi:hypothetical protein